MKQGVAFKLSDMATEIDAARLLVLRAAWTIDAHGFHAATATLIDLAGGLVATGPGGADWDDPQTRRVLEKYFAAAAPAEDRLRLIHLIGDICTGQWGGYQSVLATHAEGSLEAEKLQISRAFDPTRARAAVAQVLREAAAAVVFVHNHPSGWLEPSGADLDGGGLGRRRGDARYRAPVPRG